MAGSRAGRSRPGAWLDEVHFTPSHVDEAHARRAAGTPCWRLYCAVDDSTGLVSSAVTAGLEVRDGAPGTRLGLAQGGPAGMVELGLGGCACCLVSHDWALVADLLRRLLVSERRVQLLLNPGERSPALTGAPARMGLKGLLLAGPAALPKGRVVEIVLHP